MSRLRSPCSIPYDAMTRIARSSDFPIPARLEKVDAYTFFIRPVPTTFALWPCEEKGGLDLSTLVVAIYNTYGKTDLNPPRLLGVVGYHVGLIIVYDEVPRLRYPKAASSSLAGDNDFLSSSSLLFPSLWDERSEQCGNPKRCLEAAQYLFRGGSRAKLGI